MKSISTLLLALVAAAATLHAQIPSHGDFESWSNENTPAGWGTNNSSPDLLTTFRSTDAHSGTYAAAIYTKTYNGNIRSGIISSYSAPFTTTLRALNGWYKLKTLATDKVQIKVTLYRKNNSVLETRTFDLTTITSAWMSFSLPLDVEPDDGSGTGATSVTTSFEIIPQGSIVQAGTVAIFDDIAFETAPATVGDDGPSSTGETLAIIQDGSMLRIRTTEAHADRLSLVVYDMRGVEVMRHTAIASGDDLLIPTDALPAGCYMAVAMQGVMMQHAKLIVP